MTNFNDYLEDLLLVSKPTGRCWRQTDSEWHQICIILQIAHRQLSRTQWELLVEALEHRYRMSKKRLKLVLQHPTGLQQMDALKQENKS